MLCPKCSTEIVENNITTIFGIRGGEVGILAEGDLRVSFCPTCKIAVLSDRPIPKEDKPLIVLP